MSSRTNGAPLAAKLFPRELRTLKLALQITHSSYKCTSFALLRIGGRSPTVCGFPVTFQLPQATLMVEDGCMPHEIDQVMEDFGFPLGTFKVGDLSGIVRHILRN